MTLLASEEISGPTPSFGIFFLFDLSPKDSGKFWSDMNWKLGILDWAYRQRALSHQPQYKKRSIKLWNMDQTGCRKRRWDSAYIFVRSRDVYFSIWRLYITTASLGFHQKIVNSTYVKMEEEEILAVGYEDGEWHKPYYDCGGGNIWMMTYTVPFFGYNHTTNMYYFKWVLSDWLRVSRAWLLIKNDLEWWEYDAGLCRRGTIDCIFWMNRTLLTLM